MKFTILSVALATTLALSAPSLALAQTELKFGYAVGRDSHYGVGVTAFCDEVERATQKRFICKHFPAAALGGEREMIEAVQLGTLDLLNTSTGQLCTGSQDRRYSFLVS
jgi:TRAP-type transport system periplasmic protein